MTGRQVTRDTPLVQVALDVTTAKHAIELGRAAVAAGADWLELGKPLVEFIGIRGLAEVCAEFPGRYLLADLMIIAAPRKYLQACADLGISNATVTALAPVPTVIEAIAVGRELGVEVTVDLFNCADLLGNAVRYADAGADYLMVHFGVDQKRARPDGSPLEDLAAVAARVTTPLSYATYDARESVAAVTAGASVIVQGEPLLSAGDPLAALTEFITTTKFGTGAIR